MKKELTMIMAAMMMTSATSAVYAASFSDINNVPWEGAKAYINNVADLGIMVGDVNANNQKVFRAKDKVTYCETMQLAYTLLKNSNNLKDTSNLAKKWNGVLAGYGIPTWAQEAIAYGLEYNILSLSDVAKFMKDGKTSNDATREGVAVIFGKTLSAMNTVNTGAVLYFNDKNSIASTSVPYVDLLVRLNILVGDDNNNFNAKNYINRAEMAVIVSKTNDTLKTGSNGNNNSSNNNNNNNNNISNAASVKGTIVKTDSNTNMITILSDNKNLGFFGTDAIPVTMENSAEQLKYSDLVPGDIVTIEYEGSTVKKITVSFKSAISNATTVKGFIDEVTNDRIYINKDSGGTANYPFATNIKITIDGTDSTMKQLFDACDEGVVEAEVSIDYSGKATKIVAKESDSGAITGKIKNLDDDEIEIRKSNGKTETYDISNSVVVRLENKVSTIRKVENAMDDDTIYAKIYLDSRDRVTKIFASEDEYDINDYDGSIKSISSSRIIIKKSGGSTKEYDMAKDVTYRLDGSSSKLSEIKDAMDDDTVYVDLTLNSKDEVTKVTATTDSDDDDDDDTVKGEVIKMTSSYIKIEKSNGKTVEIDLKDDTTYRFDGSKSTLRDMRDEVNDDDVYAIVTLDSKDRADKIEASNDEDDLDEDDDDIVKGEITDISKDDIEIKRSSGGKKTYDFASSVTYRLDGSKSDYYEIRDAVKDDTVDAKITLNSKNKVTKVDAETENGSSSSTTVKGTLRNLYDDRVNIRRSDNDAQKDYYFASRIIYYLDGTEVTFRSIENAYDKYSGMKITLELNSKGDVTKLELYTNKSSDNRTVRGSVKFITNNAIKITKEDATQEEIDLASNVTITLDKSTASVSDFNKKMNDGFLISVKVIVTDGKVTSIEGTSV